MTQHNACARLFSWPQPGLSLTILTWLGLALAAPALAQTSPTEPKENASPWSIGVGSFSEWLPYRGVGGKTLALPLVGFDNGLVRWQGPSVELRLAQVPTSPASSSPMYNLAVKAQYIGDGYAADDAPSLAGMQTRRASVWVGPAASARFSWGQVSGQWLADGMGHSKGQQTRVAVSTFLPIGPVRLLPRVAWVWQDAKTVDYYYGVQSSEALANRPAFQGRASSSLELGVTGVLPLDAQQSLVMDVSTLQLGSPIKDSPLVERKQVTKLRLGYSYRF